MLKLDKIRVFYYEVILALKEVSLEVPDGSIIALLGNNGAGKSSTLKAISGLLRTEGGAVSEGSIEFDGHRIDRMEPADIVQLGIIQVMEGRRIFQHLTVEDNLRIGAYVRNDRAQVRRDMDRTYEYFPVLKELRRQTAGFLSGGEQQMLVIGRGLMSRPKLMLLDEPSLGLAPVLVKEIFDIIKRINSEERNSILVVEQNAKVALSIAHHGYVLETGTVVLEGSADMLQNNEDVKEFYLGLSTAGEMKSYRDLKHYKRRKRWMA
jgi:branched-chain amino acid transport system ATP-binding protein